MFFDARLSRAGQNIPIALKMPKGSAKRRFFWHESDNGLRLLSLFNKQQNSVLFNEHQY
jgi:hypothetical protein